MSENQRDNYLAMCLLILVTPFYILFRPRETRANWNSTSDAYEKLNHP